MAETVKTQTLVTKIKLLPTAEQAALMQRTMQMFNDTCNLICEKALAAKVYRQYDIHRLLYKETVCGTPLSSQMVIRAIAKVAGQFAREKKRHHFRSDGAVLYDKRLYTLKSDTVVSLWLLGGRAGIRMKPTAKQRATALRGARHASLVKERGGYFLIVNYNAAATDPAKPQGILGVDLGIANLAYTSTGRRFKGDEIERARLRYARHRQALQKRGTKSAKRRLKKIARKEARFRADVNHQISKQIVAEAKGTGSVIALEVLKGIRSRTTVSRTQRARHHGWSFSQLSGFVKYKAVLGGVPVTVIDPAYTSQQCPECGHISRSNRPERDTFRCEACRCSGPADFVASVNIASRAAASGPYVNLPIVTGVNEEGSVILHFCLPPVELQAAAIALA